MVFFEEFMVWLWLLDGGLWTNKKGCLCFDLMVWPMLSFMGLVF